MFISGEDCRFGPGCAFPCRCMDSNEQCNPETGHCESGCQLGILENTNWWGPGCIIGEQVIFITLIRESKHIMIKV